MDVKRKLDCVDSDHATLSIEFQLANKTLLFKATKELRKTTPKELTKIDNFLLRNTQRENFQKKVTKFFQNMDISTAISSSNDELLHLFEKHTVDAAKEVAGKNLTPKPDWFSASEHSLMTLISKRNTALKKFMKKGDPQSKNSLKIARRDLLTEKRRAKRNWQTEFAKSCLQKNFCASPKEAWKMVKQLMGGFQKHHKPFTQKLFKNHKGKLAINKKMNRLHAENHWNTVFNHHATYDASVINEIQQHTINNSLGETPSRKEIQHAIRKMKCDKAPGASQLTTDMLKNLPNYALNFIVEAIQEFWHYETDFKAWHVTKLNILYKGKGDHQGLNNYRGICLKESCAKIISTIISNCLLSHLKTFGSKTQFGMIGCQETQHTLKKALHLRQHHGFETYALFADLVKAFDTVQHPLLFGILSSYSVLEPQIKVVKKMYKDCSVSYKLDSDTINIPYKTGVQQGDNASPVLFVYIMQVFLDTVKTHIKTSKFRYFKSLKNGNLKALNRCLIGQPTASKGTPYEFNNVFCS
jgi:hypothetical protein